MARPRPGHWLLVFASAFGACGGGAPVPISGKAAAYIVPSGPDTPQTEYPVARPETEVAAGTFRVDYDMPELLVGTKQRVSLRGPLDAAGRFAAVSGDAGTATCDLMPGAGISLRCNEMLPGIVVDLTAVERVARATDPTKVDANLAVASRFSSEPIGILEIR